MKPGIRQWMVRSGRGRQVLDFSGAPAKLHAHAPGAGLPGNERLPPFMALAHHVTARLSSERVNG